MRVVYLIAEYSLHNQIVVEHLRARPHDEVSVVKVPLVLRGRGRRETAQRIVPKLSRRFLAGKLVEAGAIAAITATPKLLGRGAVFERLRGIARRRGLPFLRADDVMSEECLDFVRARRPDVIVTLFHQIVRRALIEIPTRGVLNVHPGLIPDFRGIQPYFWELSEGAERAGATVHFIEDETIDSGRLVGRTSYPVPPRASVQLNYWLTCRAAARLLPRCLAGLEDDLLEPRAQDADAGAYWSWPDSAAFDRLRSRGHPLISWRQLLALLVGRWDDHEAEEELYLAADAAAG